MKVSFSGQLFSHIECRGGMGGSKPFWEAITKFREKWDIKRRKEIEELIKHYDKFAKQGAWTLKFIPKTNKTERTCLEQKCSFCKINNWEIKLQKYAPPTKHIKVVLLSGRREYIYSDLSNEIYLLCNNNSCIVAFKFIGLI